MITTDSPRPRKHRASGVLPFIALDRRSGVPLFEQLYAGLRQGVMDRGLDAGARLASTRVIAAELGVSRFTVVSALDRLLAEGYLVARPGSGTFVVDTLPETSMRPAAGRFRTRAPVRSAPSRAPRLSLRGQALTKVIITGPRKHPNEPRPFRPRRPALDVFPVRLWARLVRRQWNTYRHEHLDYGDPAGYRPLREAIADHIGVTRGVSCTSDQVIVTSGAQQAFDLLFRLLLDPGDQAWIEEPGYLDVRAALIGAGASVAPIPVDAQGVDVAEGMRRARAARLAVVSPSHQYPTGATLSATRRRALLEWAGSEGAWVIEDDYDSYFRYRGQPMSALQTLDMDAARVLGRSPRVIYVGTFSKTMFPSLRLGFCVVPESLVDAMSNARAVADRNSPIADQAALAEFIADGHYDRHLRRARLVCEERYEAMQFHFERVLAGAIRLGPASAGTHVLAWLHDHGHPPARAATYRSISETASREDLVILLLSRYCLAPPSSDAMVLGYGGLSPSRIGAGAEQLARTIENCRAPRRQPSRAAASTSRS